MTVPLTLLSALAWLSTAPETAPTVPYADAQEEVHQGSPGLVSRNDAARLVREALRYAQEQGSSEQEQLAGFRRVLERCQSWLPNSDAVRRSQEILTDLASPPQRQHDHGNPQARNDRSDSRARAVLRQLAETLEFEPVIEAELPTGFPPPTPAGDIQLKSYPAYRLAQTGMQGGAEVTPFYRLFTHIQSNDIAMTAPVEITYGDDLVEEKMAFLYGSPTIGTTGEARGVEVVDVTPLRVVSIGLPGARTDQRIERARRALMAWLETQGLEVAGDLRVFGYNSPRVPPTRRYFEVQLPVKERVERASF